MRVKTKHCRFMATACRNAIGYSSRTIAARLPLALEKAAPGSIYNVSAGVPQPNLKIVRTILKHLGKPESLMQYVKDRPGHDRRYALDSSKTSTRTGMGSHRSI